MRLWLARFGFGPDSTVGKLYKRAADDSLALICYTIEDERREVKIKGETCIPTGTYRIKLRTEGGLHAKYKARFPELHQGMLWLQDVPGFEWVYLHVGNTDDDTDGCPLLVSNYTLHRGEYIGSESVTAYKGVYRFVLDKIEAGEEVTIEIIEEEAPS